MKKKLSILILFLAMIFSSINNAYSMSFEQAINASYSKPFATLFYANWVDDYENYLEAFRAVSSSLNKSFNFVEINISTEDVKYYNSKYPIYPNLPYVIMYKDGIKKSRHVPTSCIADVSCLSEKLRTFIQ